MRRDVSAGQLDLDLGDNFGIVVTTFTPDGRLHHLEDGWGNIIVEANRDGLTENMSAARKRFALIAQRWANTPESGGFISNVFKENSFEE